jgi:hypothetical protein
MIPKFSPLVAVLALLAPLYAAQPESLDRQHLAAHFEMTGSWLSDEVAHLSPAQWRFRATPTSWSVLDCVEHLVLAETQYWATYKETIAGKPTKEESPSEDVDRLWYGIDRTERTKTVESETPKATFTELAPALSAFLALRTTMRNYVNTTQDDWRHHLVQGWDRDTYQWLVMISAHSQRHILQIREIKHNANFPKN